MDKTFFTKSPLQMATVATTIFIFLDAFLPLNFSLQAEATEYPFKLTITLEKTTYKSREPVNVTWILTNIGDENVTLYNSRDDPLDFLIRDENFNYVFRYRRHFGVLDVVYPFAPIAPSHNRTMTGIWKHIYDGSHNVNPELRFKQVLPGTYYVAGIFSSATYDITFETPAIRIRIR